MTEQLVMDFARPPTRADQIFAAFKRFHAENPQVWELFVRFTHDAIASGKSHFSSDMVVQRIRWETDIATRGDDGLKINDHYRAYYGRMFEAAYPEYAGFFRSRIRKSAAEPAREDDRQAFVDAPATNEEKLMEELSSMVEERWTR